MKREDLARDLVRDEGIRYRPYTDSVGKLTIGVGRNLDDYGLTYAEIMFLLDNNIQNVEFELDRHAAWWRDLPEPGRRGLANMCFNIGWPRLSGFQQMLAALKAREWDKAAREALDSKWAKQVGKRADRIVALFRSCAAQ